MGSRAGKDLFCNKTWGDIEVTSEEITKELAAITNAIQKFNEENDKFDIELHIKRRYMVNQVETNAINPLSLARITSIVSKKTGVSASDINTKTKDSDIVLARQLCHYLAATRTRSSPAEIGLYFGNLNRNTVIYSKNAIQNLLNTNRAFRDKWYDFLKTAS